MSGITYHAWPKLPLVLTIQFLDSLALHPLAARFITQTIARVRRHKANAARGTFIAESTIVNWSNFRGTEASKKIDGGSSTDSLA